MIMTTTLITFGIMILVVLALGLSQIFRNKPLNTTCASTGEVCSCDSSAKDVCENAQQTESV